MEQQGDPLDESVAAAVQGDRSALSRVLETIRPVVVRYCRARVGPGDRVSVSADDVAQEVCLAVITALPRYRDQGRPFMAFVYGIAAHKVADAHRGAARSRSEPVAEVPDAPTVEDGPEQRAVDTDAARRMSELLDTLPERQREILVLRLVVGLSAEETAQAVGGTAGSVRVAQHRALGKLRTAVAGSGAAVGPGNEGSTGG
ncbi:sigma-70 family RNA polymerase sigma factor [Rhodococcus antarcticus]|jgi:RNA polymerase sigma-70 factor (ECF subfamily)|uniref:Sigma-70 family RNA polymerase sigma factor n=1 Tax=Rhodococcus antarcticus TaxID=2987751 RepID=A0ABY6P1I9_9NOCA|nr:sigma-70 family RNA polymerase sigma factor [Rhodococcus antarcticus]UZJ25383.1 sigma-70 family RNA polymerase sigma factor [Rhodococcus antarcticus]